jgi:O-antigen ligase
LAGTSVMSRKARVAVGVVFLLSMVGLTVWVGSDPAIRRFETLNDQYAHPGQDRLSIWRDTLHLIRRHPVLGSGFGSFATVYPSVQTAFLNNVVDHAHCDYLELATELGLPGGILVFGGVLCVLERTFHRCKKSSEDYDKAISFACFGSIFAILLHSLADFNLYIPANALIFVMILALAWSKPSIHAHHIGTSDRQVAGAQLFAYNLILFALRRTRGFVRGSADLLHYRPCLQTSICELGILYLRGRSSVG